jgi:hypothetical protein
MRISLRNVWVGIAVVGLVFILLQSYVAQPRGLAVLIGDGLLPVAVVATIIFLLVSKSHRPMLWLGVIYLSLTGVTLITSLFAKPYGTFFFLFGTYLLVDWFNFRRFDRSLMAELRKDYSGVAIGIVLSTFVFGWVTEVINLPFMIWSYHIPLPSLDVWGVPALIAAFGWTPWTLAILAIFYHFVLLGLPRSVEKR